MAKFKNFWTWQAKLPHWRAEDVTYYVQFNHRRPLTEPECQLLMRTFLNLQGKQFDIYLLCILPNETEMLFCPQKQARIDFTKTLEKAKVKAGNSVIKRSGERFPPFYGESYDRIIRDAAEYEEFWMNIVAKIEELNVCESADEYDFLFLQAVDPILPGDTSPSENVE